MCGERDDLIGPFGTGIRKKLLGLELFTSPCVFGSCQCLCNTFKFYSYKKEVIMLNCVSYIKINSDQDCLRSPANFVWTGVRTTSFFSSCVGFCEGFLWDNLSIDVHFDEHRANHEKGIRDGNYISIYLSRVMKFTWEWSKFYRIIFTSKNVYATRLPSHSYTPFHGT